MRIKISDIKINPGRREAEPKAIEELAKSISAVGLMNPVTLDQNNTLIAGLHRLEAAKLLGWTEIECTAMGMDDVQAELAEIDENIVRTRLNRQELCEQLLRRKEIYETFHPEARHGMRNGQTSKSANLASLETKSFAEDTAEKTGMSKRAVSPFDGICTLHDHPCRPDCGASYQSPNRSRSNSEPRIQRGS